MADLEGALLLPKALCKVVSRCRESVDRLLYAMGRSLKVAAVLLEDDGVGSRGRDGRIGSEARVMEFMRPVRRTLMYEVMRECSGLGGTIVVVEDIVDEESDTFVSIVKLLSDSPASLSVKVGF